MKVAIIDSGVCKDVFPEIILKQVRFYDGRAYEEDAVDYLGHGTSVMGCLYDKFPEVTYYSLCPGIDEYGNIDQIIEACDIACAIQYAIQLGVDFINVSMGTTDFSNRECLDEAVWMAYQKGITIVASAPNANIPALPWGCKGVFKAREIKGNGYKILIGKDEFNISNLIVQCQLFKIMTMEGKRIFSHGNSYSSVWILLRFMQQYVETQKKDPKQLASFVLENCSEDEIEQVLLATYQIVEPIEDFNFVSYKNKRLVLVSWTKEMHAIVRNAKEMQYEIVAVVDLHKKGNVGRDIGNLSHFEEYGVKVTSTLFDIEEEADVLVIGYLDQISKYDCKFSQEYILRYNLEVLRLQVFSFTPVDEAWVKRYREAGLTIRFPFVFNQLNCNRLLASIHCFVNIKKPVLGVFGTSSKQGKFTLQMMLKRKLMEKNISCYHLSTEHQAELLGAEFTFADGYQKDMIMQVDSDTKLQALRAIMVYVDNTTRVDMILVGGQSWTIPYDIRTQTFMRHAVFLEGTRPDRAVLVINPLLDDEEYVKDTIRAISSIYKCKICAVAFSDYTPYIKNARGVRYLRLTSSVIEEQSNKWEQILGVQCGCIMDQAYINQIADSVISEFS